MSNFDINNLYKDDCDKIKNGIVSGVKEGVEEGIKEGVKKGFLDGLKKCTNIGFLNILEGDVGDIEKIFEDLATEQVKKEIEELVKSKTCPSLKSRMDKTCKKALNEIKKHELGIEMDIMSIGEKIDLRGIVEQKIGECSDNLKQYLPQNFVFLIIYDGFKAEFLNVY